MDQAVQQHEYIPDRQRRLGLRVWGEMRAELVAHRGLVWQLVQRDITARYKQSVLGVAWAIILPVATLLLFAALNRSRVLPFGQTSVAYPLFAYVGILTWQLFARALTLGTQSVAGNVSILAQIKVPGEAFVLAAAGQAVFEFLMGLLPLIGLFVWYGVWPHWSVLLAPLPLLVMLVLAIGLGFLLGLANAALRDVSSVLPTLLVFWMFATPVVYPPPTRWPWVLLNHLNPASPLVGSVRSLVLEGRWTFGPELAAAALLALTTLLVGWRLFHLLEPKIAERL